MKNYFAVILLSLILNAIICWCGHIVHPSNTDTVDQKLIENIFLGKQRPFLVDAGIASQS